MWPRVRFVELLRLLGRPFPGLVFSYCLSLKLGFKELGGFGQSFVEGGKSRRHSLEFVDNLVGTFDEGFDLGVKLHGCGGQSAVAGGLLFEAQTTAKLRRRALVQVCSLLTAAVFSVCVPLATAKGEKSFR